MPDIQWPIGLQTMRLEDYGAINLTNEERMCYIDGYNAAVEHAREHLKSVAQWYAAQTNALD